MAIRRKRWMAVGFKNQNEAIIGRISYYQLGGRSLRDEEERERVAANQVGPIHTSMISSIITIKQRRGRSSSNAFTPVSSFNKHGGVLSPEGQL